MRVQVGCRVPAGVPLLPLREENIVGDHCQDATHSPGRIAAADGKKEQQYSDADCKQSDQGNENFERRRLHGRFLEA